MARNLLIASAVAGMALAGVVTTRAALDYSYEYDFVSANPNVSGKLFLDAQSSSSGTAADIGAGSYLTFNLWNGYIPPVTFNLASLNTSQDPNFTFAWNASQITTPLDIAVGLGQNDVLLSREFVNPENSQVFSPEYDVVTYDQIYLGTGRNLVSGGLSSESLVSLIATEATMNVGGGGVICNLPFDPGSQGQWVALAVPEPAAIAGVTSFGALALALFAGTRRQPTLVRSWLGKLLHRMPPNRD